MTDQCTMGVGCDEYGICYAEAHGQPEQCPLYAARGNDLPPELLERVAMTLWRTEAEQAAPNVAKQRTPDAWLKVNEGRIFREPDGACFTPVNQERWRQLARAVAPLLIAHGRELAGPLPHGTMVRKKDGHEFEGHFLCEYTDMKGRVWWMVELSTPGAKGLMFHFRREQMEPFDRSKP